MFADPTTILKYLALTDTMHVADVGSGSGHYTIAAAKMVTQGKVYSLEVQREILERLKKDIEREHLTNVECIWANVEKIGGTKLADGAVDAAIVSNIFFQIEDKSTFMKELARVVKPTGRILFVDWSESFGGMGPAPKDVVAKTTVESFFAQQGFTKVSDVPAGAHHYGMVFKKA